MTAGNGDSAGEVATSSVARAGVPPAGGRAARDAELLDALTREARRDGHGSFPLIWARNASAMLECDYVVKGLFDTGQLALLYGQSGSGKTFLAIDLAGHVASGRRWRGRRVTQGTVVYIAAEAGGRIQRRVKAWVDRYAEMSPDPALVIVPCVVNLMDPGAAQAIRALMVQVRRERNEPIKLVVIDTLARSLVGGDENSAQDMGCAVSVADTVRDTEKVATLLVHHTGKDVDRGARGSYSLIAAVDCCIFAMRNGDERTVVIEKARDDETGTGLRFKLASVSLGDDSDGDPVTTCVVEHGEEVDAVARGQRVRAMPEPAAMALRVLSDLLANDADADWRMVDGRRVATARAWRAAFDAAHGEGSLPDLPADADAEARTERRREYHRRQMVFLRARDALTEREVVVAVGEYFALNA
jgi:hypothetical protein